MTSAELDALMDGLAPVLVDVVVRAVEHATAPLKALIDAQGATIKALEARPIGAHCKGPWKAGVIYEPGDGTQWDGHYWVAQTKTLEEPGEGRTSWMLTVRRGRPGRDGRDATAGDRVAAA